jgi:hypothetical protein
MSVNVYGTAVLIGVLDSLENAPITFLRDRYYTAEVRSEKEEILFDLFDKKRRLAPFVSPLVRGKVMEKRGYSTRLFKPAYVKPKSVIKPEDAIKRVAGEPLMGNLTNAQRRDIHVRTALQEQDEAITMREEVMCAEGLRLGQVTVTGEGYPTVVLSFGRDAALREVLSGATLFSALTIDEIFEYLEDKATLVRQKSGGAIVRDVICGTSAWRTILSKIRGNVALAQVLLSSQNRGQSTSTELGPRTAEKVVYQGTVGQFNFWTYSDSYADEDGTDHEIFPAEEILMVGADVEGHRCYGAIHDPRAGLQALPRFPKDWMEEDPPAEYVMTQSAPLMVPARPNATFSAVVVE